MIVFNTHVKVLPKIEHKQEGNNLRAFYIADNGAEVKLSALGYDGSRKFTLKDLNKIRNKE